MGASVAVDVSTSVSVGVLLGLAVKMLMEI